MTTYLEDIAGITTAESSNDIKKTNKTKDTYIQPLEQTERDAIEAAIKEYEGNVSKAAKALEVSPSTIYRKIKSWEKT